MQQEHLKKLSSFFIIGINYKKSDASVRGSYAINEMQYENIIERSSNFGIEEFYILSTCNRTEIYGFAENHEQLAALLCTETKGSLHDFLLSAYSKSGEHAIEHLFEVAAGLDSQILGDYEIIGQLKEAVKISKRHYKINTLLERLVNDVLQASKKIRTNTELSGGTVSVSFAAVQYIRNFCDARNKNILLIGTGKFGSNTCKNLIDYLPENKITLVNRTEEKALLLAKQHGILSTPWSTLNEQIDQADIILVATHASSPVVLPYHFIDKKARLVIDLSIPCNVAESVGELKEVNLIGVDELSKIKDETLAKRASEIPKAKAIIHEHLLAFLDWYEMRQHVPVLKAVKKKLLTLTDDNIFDTNICFSVSSVTGKNSEERIQKVINGMAVKMKIANQRGCHYIQAINDFISPSSN